MGAYAYIDNQEIKFSGYLAEVAMENGFKLQGGMIILYYSDVSFLIVELAKKLDTVCIHNALFGSNQTLLKYSRGLQYVIALSGWLSKEDNDRRATLIFA